MALDDLAAAHDAGKVYASVGLARDMRAQLAMLAGAAKFLPCMGENPTFKPRFSGLLATAQGVRPVTILLDTGATHCFICAWPRRCAFRLPASRVRRRDRRS